MRFLVIRNPTAGWQRQSVFRGYVAALERAGAEIVEQTTSGPGDATRIAAEAEPDLAGVIAAGGDGTINEVVNGLLANDTPPPLGALPLGTANVYAAEVKLPFGQDEIAACLTAGKTRTLRVGTVSPLGEGTERHFVLMAGAGFDAQVVAKVDPTVKRLIGRGAYAIETLGTLFRADAACPTLVVDGDEVPTGSAIAVNARYYAGRFVLSKKADPFTPGMDLCLFHKTGRQAAIGYLVRVALGQIENSPVYSIKRVSSFDVTGPEGAAIQADGDIVAHAPCRISIADRTLEAIVPP